MSRIEPRTFQSKDARTLTIRSVHPDDSASLLVFSDLVDRTSEHLLSQPGERQMTLEKEREWLQKNLDDAASLALGAFDGDRFVGFLNFKGNERRRNAHHGVFGISVHPEHRSTGIGAALIRALLDWAAANPAIEKVTLGVFETNAAGRALYRKMGFKEECRREKEFKIAPGKYVDGIEMSIWVKPI